MTDSQHWRRTSPFAVLFFFGRILKALAQNAWQSLAPLGALLFAYEGELMSKLAIAAVLLGIATVTTSILQYWFFRFRITDDAVLIRQGVLQKKQLDIKFRRIQGINTEQNIVYRPLRLTTVSFDTAGSSGSEGALPAVSTDFAEQLHRKIASVETEFAEDADSVPESGNEPLLRLNWRDMLRIGLSDRRALVVLAVLGPLFEQLGDRGEAIIEDYLMRAAAQFDGIGIATGILIVVILVATTALLLAVVSIAAAFLRYHRFVLTEVRGRLQTVGGLLTRHTNTMDVAKIQLLHLRQSMLLRLFGRWNAVLRQATSSGKQRESKSLTLPVIEPQFMPELMRLAFAPELEGLDVDPASRRFQRISAYYMRPRILLLGLLPAMAAIALSWDDLGWRSLLFLIWLPFTAAMVFCVWRRYGVQFNFDGLVLRSGFIGYSFEMFLFRKVQRVTVTQSWFQQRKGLAGLRIYLASGSVKLPYIDEQLARGLRDYILYRVESSQRRWH